MMQRYATFQTGVPVGGEEGRGGYGPPGRPAAQAQVAAVIRNCPVTLQLGMGKEGMMKVELIDTLLACWLKYHGACQHEHSWPSIIRL